MSEPDTLFGRVRSVLRNEGLLIFLKKGTKFGLNKTFGRAYNRSVRRIVPKTGRYVRMNNVPCGIMEKRVFDDVLPWDPPYSDNPDYASENITLLRELIEENDNVIIIGGGFGVTAAIAAELIGPDATIDIYEGAIEMMDMIELTADLNNFQDQMELHHALVGPAISLRGDATDADVVRPDDLPECDVLEMNCEGAELDILQNLEIRPRVVIVGTHGHYGCPDDEVADVLEDLGYEIKSWLVYNSNIDASFLGATYQR